VSPRAYACSILSSIGIAECRARAAGRLALRLPKPAGPGGDEVEDVELAARVGEQPRDVSDALAVSNSNLASLKDPVLTVTTKCGELCGGLLR
jgi:hypothetical protein